MVVDERNVLKFLTFVGTCKRGIYLFPLVCTVKAVHLRGSIAREVKQINSKTASYACLLILPRFHVTVSAHCIAQETSNIVQVS